MTYTVYAGAAVVVYAAHPGAVLFWFGDVALLASAYALWYPQRLLASMMALAVLVPALAWIVGFLGLLLGAADPFGLARHLFEAQAPLPVRLASLSHVALPVVLGWLVYRLGYDPRALRAQTLLGWAVLVLGVALAPMPDRGIGGTLELAARLRQAWLPAWLWLALLMVAYPAVVYLPAHLLLQALCGPAHRRLFTHLIRWLAGSEPLTAGTGGRERRRAPGHARQARLRDFAAFALVRRRRR